MYSKYKSGYFFTKQQDKRHGTGNLTTEQREALFNLSKDFSLMIGKPDKCNGVVVMDRAKFVTKMKVILNGQSKFKAVHQDNNLDNLVKFQKFLSLVKSKGAISPEEYYRIRPTAAATPTLYGLLKLHKENVPMRPILSFIGSYNHECAAWLFEILTPLRHHQATVKDSFEFLQRISRVQVIKLWQV